MLLSGAILTIFLCILSWIGCLAIEEVQGLSPVHWISMATIGKFKKSRANTSNDWFPVCKFTNIYADLARIYFIPRTNDAILDLYQCCHNTTISASPEQCQQSVNHLFCSCFHRRKFMPVPWTPEISEIALPNLHFDFTNKQNAWLMNHWHLRKHLDHYNMKMFELLGYLGGSQASSDEFLPKDGKIDIAVSMDYYIGNLTDYEQMVLQIARSGLNKSFEYVTLNNNDNSHMNYFRFASLTKMTTLSPFCLALHHQKAPTPKGLQTTSLTYPTYPSNHSNPTTLHSKCETLLHRHQQGHSQQGGTQHPQHQRFGYQTSKLAKFPNTVYLSPIYKNNIPPLYDISQQVIQSSFRSYLQKMKTENRIDPAILTEFPCPPPSIITGSKKQHLRIAIIQRNEGDVTRIFVNFDQVLRTIQATLDEANIHVWYIDSKTPAIQQALMFCSAHVIISPHSSQLSNLVFTPVKTTVVEIRSEGFQENTFQTLCRRLHLTYVLFDEGNQPAHKNGTIITHHYGNTTSNGVWQYWNTIVNIPQLEKVLMTVKQRLKKQ